MPSSTPPAARFHFPRAGVFWLLVASVLGIVGWYKSINLLLLMAYMMVGLIALNAYLARACVKRILVERKPLGLPFAQELTRISADIDNHSSYSATVEVLSLNAAHNVKWFTPDLQPNETRRLVENWKHKTRGRWQITPLLVRSAYPFGIIRYEAPQGDSVEGIVLPSVGEVDLAWLRRWLIRVGAGDANTRRPIRRQGPAHADVRGVRPYRQGDSPREIHWRSTARRNQLIVREYDSTEPLDLILAFDPSQAMDFEASITLAASIAWAWAHADDAANVTLIVPGSAVPIRHVRGTQGMIRELLVPLADIQMQPKLPDLPLGSILRRSNRCARIVVGGGSKSSLSALLTARFGVPFVNVKTKPRPPWFHPPLVVPFVNVKTQPRPPWFHPPRS